jgi:DNA-nicking Smr family endonuclease
MDFGDILKDWEKDKTSSAAKKSWLDKYPPTESGKGESFLSAGRDQGQNRQELKTLSPERSLDLHGLNAEDAGKAVDEFVDRAVDDGLRKVLIIHGKGKHSSDGRGVLTDVVWSRLRSHPMAGEIGVPARSLGGSGAVWVAIRYRSR